jgi:hypothetical protein
LSGSLTIAVLLEEIVEVSYGEILVYSITSNTGTLD